MFRIICMLYKTNKYKNDLVYLKTDIFVKLKCKAQKFIKKIKISRERNLNIKRKN